MVAVQACFVEMSSETMVSGSSQWLKIYIFILLLMAFCCGSDILDGTTPAEPNKKATTVSQPIQKQMTPATAPINVSLTLLPDQASLPFSGSLNVTCHVSDKMAGLGPKLCKMTLFKLSTSAKSGRQAMAERILLAETVAGGITKLLIREPNHTVTGSTLEQKITLTKTEVTSADKGAYGCDVTFIRDQSSLEAEAVKMCASGMGNLSSEILRHKFAFGNLWVTETGERTPLKKTPSPPPPPPPPPFKMPSLPLPRREPLRSPEENPVTSPAEKPVTSPEENPVTPLAAKPVTSPAEKHVTSPTEKPVTSPVDDKPVTSRVHTPPPHALARNSAAALPPIGDRMPMVMAQGHLLKPPPERPGPVEVQQPMLAAEEAEERSEGQHSRPPAEGTGSATGSWVTPIHILNITLQGRKARGREGDGSKRFSYSVSSLATTLLAVAATAMVVGLVVVGVQRYKKTPQKMEAVTQTDLPISLALATFSTDHERPGSDTSSVASSTAESEADSPPISRADSLAESAAKSAAESVA